jgi:hypothetical protein
MSNAWMRRIDWLVVTVIIVQALAGVWMRWK